MWLDLIGLALFLFTTYRNETQIHENKNTKTILAKTLSIAQKSKLLISVFC